MTEEEWLQCTDPTLMLEQLQGGVSDRKLRLFSCACYRRIPDWLTFENDWRAVEIGERIAEGIASQIEVADARICAYDQDLGEEDPLLAAMGAVCTVGVCAADRVAFGEQMGQQWKAIEKQEHGEFCGLLRCIFGDPFRPVHINPAWLTPTVVALATAAYEERTLPSGELETARLAVLADALEEAGCQDANIQGHLRSPGPHVRNCWVVDLLLGKE